MAVTRVNGLDLHYNEFGAPEAVPVIALHGHPGPADTWDEVAAKLSASGRYRFLALTQRGYDPSGRASAYSLDAFRDDVFGFADALGLDRFVLMGHSMGAVTATLAAELNPDRLLALVLEDSAPPRDGFPLPPRPAGDLPYDWELAVGVFGQLADPDPAWWTGLSAITAPTLVVAGGSTSHVPQELLTEAAALIPRSRLVTLEGAGHTAHGTQPDRFVAEVTRFLDACLDSGGAQAPVTDA